MGNNKYGISDTDYYEMSRFVEKLYLEQFDLLILMARKFYSLFMLFQQLNTEKLENLDIQYVDLLREKEEKTKDGEPKYKRKIINDNAIDLLEYEIRCGHLKKIIIADDIIIHGRGVRSLYDKLLEWNKDVDISIKSLIRNDDDDYYYNDIYDHLTSEYIVGTDVWKEISSSIVKVFYMSGRPYISYLPYCNLNMNWEELCKRIDVDQCHRIDNELMEKLSVKGLLYTGSKIERFSQVSGVSISAVRLYYYEKLEQVTIIPYFCMDVIESESLSAISNNLRKLFLEKGYNDILAKNNWVDSTRLRELEYVLSLWLGMYFFNAIGIQEGSWCYDSEIYSFSRQIVSHDTLTNEEIEHKLEQLVENTGEIKSLKNVFVNKDLNILRKRYNALKKKYRKYANRWEDRDIWYGTKDYEKRFLEELLSVNGTLDERRFRKEKKRLLGIPLSFVVKDLGVYFNDLSHDNKDVKWYSGKVFAAIISLADSGKGTIFTRSVKTSLSNGHNESLLHAGEQNFVFYENTNFPALYALYIIEMLGRFADRKKEKKAKVKFMIKYKKYMNVNKLFYVDKELKQLLSLEVKKEYGRCLLDVYYDYENNPLLIYAVNQALTTVKVNRNGQQTGINNKTLL